MISLDRLKQTLSRARSTIAVPLISLAMASLGAQAATFIPSTATCDGGAVDTSALPDVNGVTGVKIFTTSTCSAVDDGSGTATLTLTVSGTGTGSFHPSMVTFPVNFVFTVNSTDAYSQIRYDLSLQLNGLTPQETDSFWVNPGTTVDSSDTMNFNSFNYNLNSPGMSLDSWIFTLIVSQVTLDGGQTISLDVPSNSIDITGGELSTPEPSSLLLLGSGVGLLLLGKRAFRRA